MEQVKDGLWWVGGRERQGFVMEVKEGMLWRGWGLDGAGKEGFPPPLGRYSLVEGTRTVSLDSNEDIGSSCDS